MNITAAANCSLPAAGPCQECLRSCKQAPTVTVVFCPRRRVDARPAGQAALSRRL